MGKVKRPKLIQNTANFYTLEEAEHLISAVHGDLSNFLLSWRPIMDCEEVRSLDFVGKPLILKVIV